MGEEGVGRKKEKKKMMKGRGGGDLNSKPDTVLRTKQSCFSFAGKNIWVQGILFLSTSF